MRVLVVEDDCALGLFLQKGLRIEGHDVKWVEDGEAAIQDCQDHAPDLIVLDLSLPRKDGTEVLRELRTLLPTTSVIVLTGRSELSDRVECLNLGADDYLLKPFSFKELIARCRALTRRQERFESPLLRHGGVELNRMDRKVTLEGNRVDLTVKEFALLEYMLQKRGQTCSRAELLRDVWGMSPGSNTNVVDVYINYLRKKLTAASGDGKPVSTLIETVRGKGYLLSNARPAQDGRSMVPVHA